MIQGVGTDIVEIERLKEKPDLWKRFLSGKELLWLEKFRFKEEHIAGIWAAKEALVKALDDASIDFRSVTVAHSESGKPFFEDIAVDGVLHLSISHERKFATAVVVWEK